MSDCAQSLGTHTIRAKSSQNPIVTFTPKFFAQLLKAEPDASSLTLAWFTLAYKNLTGKTIRIDHDQEMRLLERYGADDRGVWCSRFTLVSLERYLVIQAFCDGLLARTASTDVVRVLAVASEFYTLAGLWLGPHD